MVRAFLSRGLSVSEADVILFLSSCPPSSFSASYACLSALLSPNPLHLLSRARRRRPRFKYREFFSLSPLLAHLHGMGQAIWMSLESLRDRTIVLLRITSLLRASDVAKIDPSSVQFAPDLASVSLEVVRPKESRGAYERAKVTVPAYKDARLDPVTNLLAYIERTGGLPRPSLFLYLKHRKPLSTDRIANVCKATMQAAGVPTEFSSHALRGAVATELREREGREAVMRAGRWASESCFSRHYDRAVPDVMGSLRDNG